MMRGIVNFLPSPRTPKRAELQHERDAFVPPTMNIQIGRPAVAVVVLLSLALIAHRVDAVEALLLQDTYVDNGTNGGNPPNASNYGSGMDLRVFRGNGRLGRAFLKFSLDTLPAGTKGTEVTQARLRLWVNANTTAAGSINLRPVTVEWDEYKLTDSLANLLAFSEPLLRDLPIASMNNFVSIDVTPWVKAWLDNKLVNEGIVIEPGADTDFLDLSFDSKESTQTSHEARLEITLSNQ